MSEYITQNETIRSGEKCLAGTRLTIDDVVSIVKQGEESDYQLTKEEIDACFLSFDETKRNEDILLNILQKQATGTLSDGPSNMISHTTTINNDNNSNMTKLDTFNKKKDTLKLD